MANTGPRGDYAEVWRFPCCGATVVGEIRDGAGIQPLPITGMYPWRTSAADNRRASCRCSTRSLSSKYCSNEVNYALNSEKQVLPVHLEPTELPKCLLLSLAGIQAIVRYRLGITSYSKALVSAIQKLRAEPDAAHLSNSSVALHLLQNPYDRLFAELRSRHLSVH